MENLGQAKKTQLRDIPMDVVMDIFARVPARTVASCRSVSKQWRSIIGRPGFTELFLTMSWTRPRLLLFTFQFEGKIFNFSLPQPQNPDDESSLVATRYHVHYNHSPTDFSFRFGSPLGGFICRRDRDRDGGVTMVICNPITGESVSLPKVESMTSVETIPFLGYDPVDKQFKVLGIKDDGVSNTHHIVTLENGNHLWRAIQCKPHFPKSRGICIDGVLYYTAGVDPGLWVNMIVCFDFRSEKFSFISIDDEMMNASCTLINYKGKLSALQFTCPRPRRLEFWVLEDAVKRKWSKKIYIFPSFRQSFVDRSGSDIVGMTGQGEVVLSSPILSDPFYIYCYKLESNRFTRVRIQGLEGFKRKEVYTSIDYAENLKLMTEYGKGAKSNTFSPKEAISSLEYANEASKVK
uniref:F-box protein n=1 Tax=Noccaea caerulescens TaxID=107243 RepID=A0A1J3IX61_NOCCA